MTTGDKFSERYGHVPVRTGLQTDSLDETTRARLWNALAKVLPGGNYTREDAIWRALWDKHLKKLVSSMPTQVYRAKHELQSEFMSRDWHACLDLLEFVIGYGLNEKHAAAINKVLQEEGVGYHFVNGLITPIVYPEQIDAITGALADSSVNEGARSHLTKALAMLRPGKGGTVDGAAVVREAISAVEAQVSDMLGERETLGAGLHKLKKRRAEAGKPLHPALESAMSKLYGYTSDEGGIRHASIEFETNVTTEDAVLMVVVCSAYVSWLKAHG